MPKNSRVHRCADKLESEGKEKGSAIAICQSSTNQSYKTGRSLDKSIKSLREKYSSRGKKST